MFHYCVHCLICREAGCDEAFAFFFGNVLLMYAWMSGWMDGWMDGLHFM